MAREMKDSGISWIGEIPANWVVQKNKKLFHEVNERCEDGSEYTLLSVSEYTGVTPRSSIIKEGEFETHAKTLDGYKICHEGDIVMNIMLAWKRATAASSYEGIISPSYCVFRGNGVDTKYYHYLFRTDNCAEMFKRYSTGIIDSRLRLYPDVFLSLKSIVPPYSEQKQIATYLDSECNRIDAVIEKTRVSIEEYKKLKQSVITQAVTKGIRPNREMKDSGIEWIEEIPEQWSVSRIKDLFLFGKGLPITKENLVKEGIAVISYGQIHSKENTGVKIQEELFRFVPEHYLESNPASLVKCSDFIFADTSEDRDGCGNCVFVDTERLIFAGYHTIVLRSSDENNKYLAYLFRTDAWRSQIRSKVSGIKVFSITKKILGNATVLLPSDEEQQEIVDMLDNRCAEIDKAIKRKADIISELKLYKKSLIFECVTGKKEVM